MIKQPYGQLYPIDKNKLQRNRWLFIREGLRRGYDIKKIQYKKRIFYVEKDGKGFMYDTSPGAVTSRVRFPYIVNKAFQKQNLVESGLSVAKTFAVIRNENDLRKIKYEFPCVVKPTMGSRSRDVFTNIQTKKELYVAVKAVLNNKSVAIVEKCAYGKEYRILVINGKFVSCVERCVASVVGDGIHTIEELINVKNADSARGPRNSITHVLHDIVIDDELNSRVSEQGFVLNDVVEDSKLVKLGTRIGSMFGGDIIDKTNDIHQSFAKMCERFVQKYNFFIIGFDVIAEDISRDIKEQEYIFNELNEQPFFTICEECNIGDGVPVASIMWDEIEKSDIMTEKFLLF